MNKPANTRSLIRWLSGAVFIFVALAAQAEELSDTKRKRIEYVVEEVRADWNVPGIAVAVVFKGTVVFAEGFGEEEFGSGRKITAGTLFALGSATKPLTALAAGMVMRDRGIGWTERVVDHLEEFELPNPEHTRQILIGDLLGHSTGLVDQNLFWYGSGLERRDVIEGVKHLQIFAPARTRFMYNNMAFVAAGGLIEQWSGMTYEEFLRENIFRPLGMSHTFGSLSEISLGYETVAKPHILLDGVPKAIPLRDLTNAAPAGGVLSTASDMGVLLGALLGSPLNGVDSPFESDLVSQTISLRTAIDPSGPPLQIDQEVTPLVGYGLGWFVASHRGHRLAFHPGGYDGMSASIGLLPNLQLGIVVLSNLDSNFGVLAIQSEIIDVILGVESADWSKRYKEVLEPALEFMSQIQTPQNPVFTMGSEPYSDDITGVYEHDYLGSMLITALDGEFAATWGDFHASIKPVDDGIYTIHPSAPFRLPLPLIVQFGVRTDSVVEASFLGERGWLRTD